MDDETYKIVRIFERGGRETLQTGLTLAEAKEHCNDPETSSATATDPEAVKLTEEKGKWFDAWYAE